MGRRVDVRERNEGSSGSQVRERGTQRSAGGGPTRACTRSPVPEAWRERVRSPGLWAPRRAPPLASPYPRRAGCQGRPLPPALRPRGGREAVCAGARASSAAAGDRLRGRRRPERRQGRRGRRPKARGEGGLGGRPGIAVPGRGAGAGARPGGGLGGLKAAGAALPTARPGPAPGCGRRAIHTPSGHSARRGGGGAASMGISRAGAGWGRGPAAGARCYAVAAGPAARTRRPHYAGNAV